MVLEVEIEVNDWRKKGKTFRKKERKRRKQTKRGRCISRIKRKTERKLA
jgi:hypothetical protein